MCACSGHTRAVETRFANITYSIIIIKPEGISVYLLGRHSALALAKAK